MKTNVYLREDDILKEVKITSADKPELPTNFINKWQDIITLISKIIKIPSALIMKISREEMQVFLKSQNNGNPYDSGAGESLGNGLYCETVIGKNKELLVANALLSDSWKDNPDIKFNMISYYGLPIRWPDNEIFGTICVLDNVTNSYNEIYKKLIKKFRDAFEDDLRILIYEKRLKKYYNKAKINSIINLRNKNNFFNDKKLKDNKSQFSDLTPFINQLDKIIYYDNLTGLHNRRFFMNQLNTMNLNKIYPISIVLGDLDNLKLINDNHGHNIGDDYIKKAAAILKNNFREHDILARIGGDEFAVILPETDKEEAELICGRIKEKFIKTNKELNLKCPLRISLGISTLEDSSDKIEKTFVEADENMYKNKRGKIEYN
ncbi:MAG: sensor domain-containing diguanylate cyclase [bacterium]